MQDTRVKIIAIAGRAGAGKSALAARLSDQPHVDSRRISLATPIKRAVGDWLWTAYGGVTDTFDVLGIPQHAKAIDLHDIVPAACDPGSTVRKMLQRVGTEGARSVVPSIWTHMAIGQILREAHASQDDCLLYIIDDVRFSDELDTLMGVFGDAVVAVHMPSPDAGSAHASECGFAPGDLRFDITIPHDRPRTDSIDHDLHPYVQPIVDIVTGSHGCYADVATNRYKRLLGVPA